MRHIGHGKTLTLLAVALAVAALAGCGGKDEGLEVSDSQVVGLWQKAGTQEYWHYYADHTGATWDVADDILHEGDSGTISYTWSVQGDQLGHLLSGTSIGVRVPRTYTITEVGGTYMVREEEIGTYRLNRVEGK